MMETLWVCGNCGLQVMSLADPLEVFFLTEVVKLSGQISTGYVSH